MSDAVIREPASPPAFDAVGTARQLLRLARHGALSTLAADGRPFPSLVTLATDLDGVPVIITSHLSGHTQHLQRDPRVGLLVADIGRGDPLAHPRVTLAGTAVAARPEDAAYARLRGRFLARNPKAELYVDLPGFWFWRIEPAEVSLNGGFARAWNGPWADVATDLAGADELLALADSAIAHMNEDHADALSLYATVLCKAGPGRWRATGLDPEGLDLVAGEQVARLTFPRRVTDGRTLRLLLKDLADAARGAAPA